MNRRLLLTGLIIWTAATLGLRWRGQYLLQPGGNLRTLLLFAASFPLTAWLVRRLCQRSQVAPEQWLTAAVSLLFPTLLLDPFSSAFFPVVFPNIAPEMAGVFGGWMLWCCAGGIAGVLIETRKRQ